MARNDWEAFAGYAERHAGATRVSGHIIDCRGLRFCSNGTITIVTLNQYGREISRKTVAKNRTPFQMFLVLKNLIEQEPDQAAGGAHDNV